MLNIEKYKDEIKAELEKDSTLGCVVNKLMGNTCDDYPKCNDCYLKVLDWLLQECKEPILTDEGIEFLKEHIKQSGKTAVYIKIKKNVANYYDYRLEIHLDTGLISIPFVEKDNLYEMFKNVEIGQDYTPEELGI